MSPEAEKRPRLAAILDYLERVIYYGVAVALLVTVGMLFVSAGQGLLAVFDAGTLETSLTVLDRVLLILIFVELLNTIEVIVQEREIVAEPFLLIGLIAVVRRILLVTAEAKQDLAAGEFQNLIIELGVLTALVLALAGALYITRRMESRRSGTK